MTKKFLTFAWSFGFMACCHCAPAQKKPAREPLAMKSQLLQPAAVQTRSEKVGNARPEIAFEAGLHRLCHAEELSELPDELKDSHRASALRKWVIENVDNRETIMLLEELLELPLSVRGTALFETVRGHGLTSCPLADHIYVLSWDLEPAFDLGRSEEFLATPLPEKDPSRYRRWRERAQIRVGYGYLDHASFSPDEKLFLTLSDEEGVVRVYDNATKKLLQRYPIPGFNTFDWVGVTFWPTQESGTNFLLSTKDGLFLVNAKSGELIQKLSDIPCGVMRWSPDKRILICTPREEMPAGSVGLVFFAKTGPKDLKPIKTMAYPARIDAVDLSRDNRLLALVTYPDRLVLVELATFRTVWDIAPPAFAHTVDISPDDRAVAVGGDHLLVVDIEDPQKRATFRKFDNNLDQVRFSPSGDAIAASAYDGRIRIVEHNLENPDLKLLKLLRHAGTANVYNVEFNRDGSGLASTSGDRTVRFFAGK